MASLRITVFKIGKDKAETVVTIPLGVVRVASKLMPNKVKLALEKEGIDLGEIASLAEKQAITGNLVEIETETEHVVIAIE